MEEGYQTHRGLRIIPLPIRNGLGIMTVMTNSFRPENKTDIEPPPDPNQDFEVALFAAEIGDVPTIDLHGNTVTHALARVDEFIHHELMQGSESVKIIHGRGGGWLRDAIQKYLAKLQQQGLVALYRGSTIPPEQNAVMLVALHRIKA